MLLKMTLFHFILWLSKPRQSFPGGSDGKESACNVEDLGSIPGLGRFPGGGHGNPLQYSCLAGYTVHQVTKSQD